MTYPEVIKMLFVRRSQSVKCGLETSRLFAENLGQPQKAYPTVHIAGTNGKGSVSLKIAKALQLSGLKVGLFTSPHLISFRERITINGVQISKERARAGILSLFELSEKIDPAACFFELTTFLAFQYFREEAVDVAVIEAGIGGLCDTTNVIMPLVSVITSIAHDHADMLGSTLEAIAVQKAGIIKPQIPVVVGPYANYAAIRKRAKECQSPLFITKTAAGFYDWENSNIAHQALQLLKSCFHLTEGAIERGLSLRPPCRFEQVGNVILDVAHNSNGISRLLEAMETHYPGEPFSVIIGMSKDKDIALSLKLLAQKAAHIFLVQGATTRAAGIDEMGEILIGLNYSHFTSDKTVIEALRSTQDGLVLVCGTFYIMQEARQYVLGVQVGAE